MTDPSILLAILVTFFLAGSVKGVIGLGLPTVSLAILTVVLDLPTAMALLLVPSLLTNVWQATTGGNSRTLLARLWPFLLMASATVWIGARALTSVDLSLLSALLGLLLVVYALLNLMGHSISVPPKHEIWLGPVSGAVNGLLTGMTGSFMLPGVIFLQGLGLSRDLLIQAMGMLFTASTIALGLALQGNKLLSVENAWLSTAALIPAMLGMLAGQQVRKHLSESLFKRLFFVSLLGLGLYIILNALAA